MSENRRRIDAIIERIRGGERILIFVSPDVSDAARSRAHDDVDFDRWVRVSGALPRGSILAIPDSITMANVGAEISLERIRRIRREVG